MKNKIFFIGIVLALLTACKADFDPITDSSVRTMCVSIDSRDILDNFLVAKKDTFILGYHDPLPSDIQLRITAYCYHNDGSLHSKHTLLTRDLAIHKIFFSHVDTLQQYSICCVADFVHRSTDDVIYSNWVQMIPRQLSQLYTFHCTTEGSIENQMAVIRWTGSGSEQIGPLTFQPATYNGYFRLINFQSMNYVYFRWQRFSSILIWENTPLDRLRYSTEIKFYPTPTLKDTLVPMCLAYGNDSVYYKVKTRLVSTMDSASYRIFLNHQPFVCTVDCKKHKVVDIIHY